MCLVQTTSAPISIKVTNPTGTIVLDNNATIVTNTEVNGAITAGVASKPKVTLEIGSGQTIYPINGVVTGTNNIFTVPGIDFKITSVELTHIDPSHSKLLTGKVFVSGTPDSY